MVVGASNTAPTGYRLLEPDVSREVTASRSWREKWMIGVSIGYADLCL